jgi:DNA (cytosine-5)-methyltransferase 1
MIRLGTVFSGIGSIEHALDRAGAEHEIVFACDNGERHLKVPETDIRAAIAPMTATEANKYIAEMYNRLCGENMVEKTYRANFEIDDARFFQDVRFLDGKPFRGLVDLFVGGSPCQSFSIMGKRRGLDEARGTLFYEYARLVDEIQPKVFVYENVTGMLNHDSGHTWDVISHTFDELGYSWTHWVLNAKDYGLPQNRRRVFAIGYRHDFADAFSRLVAPVPLPLDRDMTAFLQDNVDNRYYLPEKGFKRVIDPAQTKHVALNGRVARCQVACQQYNWYGDMRFETEIPKRLETDARVCKGVYKGRRGVARCLTPRECLRLMGFDDSFRIVVNDHDMYRQVGNSIAVNTLVAVVQRLQETGVFEERGKT